MVTIEMILEDIEDFEVKEQSGTIEVGFEDYILEMNLSDMEGLEITKENIAKVILEKYLDE